MLYFICLAPFLLAIIYSFYLLVKRKDIHDEFFHLSRKIKKETIIERIRLLEKINKADYRSDIIQIEKFYSDGRITEAEANKMETIITNTYFDNFQSKWIAFKRSEFPMKALFILSILYGFFYVNLVFIEGYNEIQLGISMELMLIIVNASLILPYLFSLTLLGFFAMFISMLNLSFSESGGVNRAAITSEELVKALKPGGRKTKIVLGRAWSRTFFRI